MKRQIKLIICFIFMVWFVALTFSPRSTIEQAGMGFIGFIMVTIIFIVQSVKYYKEVKKRKCQ